MRRLAALSMLLLLLQTIGAGVVLGQVSADDAHGHCGTAVIADAGTHSPGHSTGSDDPTSGDRCGMPWMTNCGASSACSVQAMRAPAAAAHHPLAGATAGRPRDSLAPDSPSADLEAPPPRD